MSWHSPQALWFLLVPLVLAVWELTRRARASAVPHPKILRAEAAPGRLSLATTPQKRETRPRFRWRLWLGLSLAVVALARPQWGEVEEQVFDQAREILIAVDLSRSMLAPDVPPSRLERARLLITSLLERLEGERVGLLVFAGTAFLQSPLSADYEILREFLPALEPEFLPRGGTDYAAMLQAALEGFGESESADRFLIVLSDGESQTDAWQTHVGELTERGVKVISLGIGTAEGAMLPDGHGGLVKDERGAVVLSRLNPSTLEDLARRTSGIYRDASSWVDLAELLRETVEAGRQGEFTETSRVRQIERFQWVLAPALLLLLASYWREFPVHPRPRKVALEHRNARSASATATTAGVGAMIVLGWLAASPHSAAARQSENAFAAPLSQTVARLSAQPELNGRDLAELAQSTIAYGERMVNAQQRPEPGVVDDALAAVAAGERLDPQAADWDQLREQLEALKPDKPEEQPEEPQQDEQQDEQQDQSDSKDQEKQPSEGSQPQSPPPEDGQPNPADQKQPPEQQGDPGESSSQSAPPDASEQQSAFGEMEEPPPTENPPPNANPAETQQVGGQSQQPYDLEQDPSLTVPLQRLEQLKQQDSPAELYQLMQDPNARPPEKGRDW